MKKSYCYNCKKDVFPDIKKEDNVYVVHNEKIKVKESILLCPNCKSELIDDNLDEALTNIYNYYLKKYDLSLESFKEIRNSYNLSQDLFAKALNWSKRSIIRYENGDSLPPKQYLKIYQKIAKDKNAFIKIVLNNKDTMAEKTYYKIFSLINADFDYKTINTFLYILKDNYLNKTQIMKYMFAVDFKCYKEYQKPITKLKYAHGKFGPIIDKKTLWLDYLLQEKYIVTVNDEDDNVRFYPAEKCDEGIFSEEEKKVLDLVIAKFKGKSAKSLSDWSHRFDGWINTKEGEIIKYSTSNSLDI